MKGSLLEQVANEESAGAVELRSLETLLAMYLNVKRCWNSYPLCLAENMTFERACNTLREVRDESNGRAGGARLSTDAHKLLWEIVNTSEPVQAVEDAIKAEEAAEAALAENRKLRVVH